MGRVALFLGAVLLVTACSESAPKVRVKVETGQTTSTPGVSIRTERSVVPEESSPAEANEAGKAADAGPKGAPTSTPPKAGSASAT